MTPDDSARLYAMRWTGEWVSRDLPCTSATVTDAIGAPGGCTVDIEPQHADLTDERGLPVFREWDTLLFVEESGQLRGGGILTRATASGDSLRLECDGFTALPQGAPLDTTIQWGGKTDGRTGNGVDPADVVRALWDHFQAQPDSNLGVVVDDISTPYRLGEWVNAAGTDNEETLPIDRVWSGHDDRPKARKGKTLYWRYILAWHDDVEIGRTIDDVCSQAGLEYREEISWGDADKETVHFRLALGYPRLGHRRANLAFVEDVNVVGPVEVQRDGTSFANAVIAYGSGEGSKQLRAYANRRDGRLRRYATVDASDVTEKATLQAIADAELRKLQHTEDISRIEVMEHPNAARGTFHAGDDILIHVGPGWAQTSLWVRILSMDTDLDSGATTIDCTRSDSFDYWRH